MLKEKQDYLYRQIIEADYDPESFQEFIDNRRGINLDLYTLQELVQIVKQFKSHSEEPQLQPAEIYQKLQAQGVQRKDETKEKMGLKHQDEKQHEPIDKKGLHYGQKHSWNSSNKIFHQFLLKQDISSLYDNSGTKGRLQVKIRSFSKSQEDNIFRNQYINYTIETPSKGWSVKRRFSDFEWLHSKLSEMYAGLPVPPIPKKTTMRYFNDLHLEERMIIFEKCINKMLQVPELCSDPILEQFMRVGSSQQFLLCKNRYQVRLNGKGNKIFSLRGQELLDMTLFQISSQDVSAFSASHSIVEQLNSKIEVFQKSLKATTEKAFELASALNEAHKKFKMNNFKASNILQSMGDFINQVGVRLDNEYFFVRDNMQNYFGYQQKYLGNILSAVSKLNKFQEEMTTKYKNISSSSAELESEEQHSKSKLMGDFMLNKELYRIKMSFLNQEIERYKTSNLMILGYEWHESLVDYVGTIKNMMLSGVDQLTKVMCIIEGKQLMEVEYLNAKARAERMKISQES